MWREVLGWPHLGSTATCARGLAHISQEQCLRKMGPEAGQWNWSVLWSRLCAPLLPMPCAGNTH